MYFKSFKCTSTKPLCVVEYREDIRPVLLGFKRPRWQLQGFSFKDVSCMRNHQFSFEKNVFRIHNRMFLKCSNANSFFGRVLNISPRNSWIRRILSVCLFVSCKRIWTFFTIRYFLLAEGMCAVKLLLLSNALKVEHRYLLRC